MSAQSADERITRARSAQIAWARTGMRDRVRELARLRKQIALDRESIVEAIVADTGKPPLDALGGDVLVTLEMMRFYERRAERLLRPRRVGRSRLFFPRCRFTEHFEPHGVALVFGPANYPLQLSIVPAITALYAGNAVVLKVSEKTPAVARIIEDIANRAALPPDLLQVTTAGPEEAVELIDARPDFIFFTGSSSNGKAVAARAATLGTPALLELGGSDPAIVFADCDTDRAVEGIVYGAFSNGGQVCVGVKRLFVERPLYQGFLNALVRRAAQLRVGAGDDCDLGKLPSESGRAVLTAQVQDALTKGARLETSGDAIDGPIILSEVSPDARLAREECFGPVLCVQAFTSEREAIDLANASPYALGASVWTRDLTKGRRVSQALASGSCAINDVIRNIANPHAAFGGNGASGYGRYHGAEGLYAFSRVKTVMENRSSKQSEINWFPLGRKKYEGLNTLIEWLHRPRGAVAALRRILRLAAFAAALGSSAVQAQAAHLLLQVKLPAGAHGRVAYLLFSSANGFPQDKSKAVKHGFSDPVGQGSVQTIDLGDMPPGRYAASVYLDENENGKLDSGFLGIPKEPVGASNNPHHRMGPPHFEDCVFTMNSSNLSLSIQLVRP
ncbi:aldehyde dehydrogenase family protein [Occallatibacter savannae]|uniref:aldehyde dehydrogenase family protein n=1 Tax=Occallatibacter savannae TaxID=1002691 RepID=UPI000D68BE84|nr:aldehyde dehydrogenase family protein [Occallatibacter savannae]